MPQLPFLRQPSLELGKPLHNRLVDTLFVRTRAADRRLECGLHLSVADELDSDAAIERLAHNADDDLADFFAALDGPETHVWNKQDRWCMAVKHADEDWNQESLDANLWLVVPHVANAPFIENRSLEVSEADATDSWIDC